MAIILSHPYIDIESVKRYCGEDKSLYDDDFRFGINKASRLIDGYSHRNFYKTTITDEYVVLTGWRIVNEFLYTPKLLPVIAISEIEENGTVLVENTDYYIDKEIGVIEKVGNWSILPRVIKITGTIGYDSTGDETPSVDIPEEISSIALELAARFSGRFNKRKMSITGTAENIDIYEVPAYIIKKLEAMRPVVL